MDKIGQAFFKLPPQNQDLSQMLTDFFSSAPSSDAASSSSSAPAAAAAAAAVPAPAHVATVSAPSVPSSLGPEPMND